MEADAIKNRDVVYQQPSRSLPSSSNIAAEVGWLHTQASLSASLCIKSASNLQKICVNLS